MIRKLPEYPEKLCRLIATDVVQTIILRMCAKCSKMPQLVRSIVETFGYKTPRKHLFALFLEVPFILDPFVFGHVLKSAAAHDDHGSVCFGVEAAERLSEIRADL